MQVSWYCVFYYHFSSILLMYQKMSTFTITYRLYVQLKQLLYLSDNLIYTFQHVTQRHFDFPKKTTLIKTNSLETS